MQAFVKFFDQAANRSPRDRSVLDAARYKFCTYLRGRSAAAGA